MVFLMSRLQREIERFKESLLRTKFQVLDYSSSALCLSFNSSHYRSCMDSKLMETSIWILGLSSEMIYFQKFSDSLNKWLEEWELPLLALKSLKIYQKCRSLNSTARRMKRLENWNSLDVQSVAKISRRRLQCCHVVIFMTKNASLIGSRNITNALSADMNWKLMILNMREEGLLNKVTTMPTHCEIPYKLLSCRDIKLINIVL